jgi:hypothetical protein
MCCSVGAVELPIANDTPEPIRVLLTETHVNANGKVVWTNRTAHFQQYIRSYNNSVAFTSLGAKLDRAITDTLNAVGVYTFRIHDGLYHSMGSLLPPLGEQGQTFNHVGLCVTEPVFTHGQLYVALSRVTDAANLRIIVPDTPEARREGKIKNVVYSEVFS